MRRTLRTILLLTTLLMIQPPAIPVQADVAPPENPSGTGIGPDQDTRVQMVAEEVVYDLPVAIEENGLTNMAMTATFQMRNQGAVEETMRVGFPMGCDPVENDASVTVDGQPVDLAVEEGKAFVMWDDRGPCESNSWLRFDVTFPSEQDVEIVVKLTYMVHAIESYIYYDYILETGSGWYGPIGKGAFVFNLPYQPENLNLQGSWYSSLVLSRTYGDHTVRFTFNNLEPTENNNLYFVIGNPYTWQQVDIARQYVKDHPQDPQAYIQLGGAYDTASRIYHGTDMAVAKLAVEAYNHALRLDPYAADAHVGLAWVVLAMNTKFREFDIDIYADPFKPVLDHLAKALAIDPTNESGLALLDELNAYTTEPVRLPTIDPGWFLPNFQPTKMWTPTQPIAPSITYTPTQFRSSTPRPTKSPYQTFTPPVMSETPVPAVIESATVPTATSTTSQQSTVQGRAGWYLVLIVVMGGIAYLMWRRDQGK